MTVLGLKINVDITSVVLFCITMLSRIPFTSKYLFHTDSVQYALGLDNYNVVLHQPHPPGYFVYILLGRFARIFFQDPNMAFISLSIIFTSGTVVVVYQMTHNLFGNRCALIAALLAMTSPNLWFHGEVAMNYGIESFFSCSIAYLCWKIRRENNESLLNLLAIMLAASGGIRQNTPVFMLPLVIYACKDIPLRKLAFGVFLFLLICLLWFVPMLLATGGWNLYSSAFRELWHFNTGHHTVFNHGLVILIYYANILFSFIIYGIGGGVVILPLACYTLIRRRKISLVDSEQFVLFFLWIMPAFIFYLMIFIHPANPGYALIITPPLIILLAQSVIFLQQQLSVIKQRRWDLAICTLLVATNLCLFLVSSYPISYSFIHKHDRSLAKIIERLKTFDPNSTAFFAGPYLFSGFRHLMYYMPDYLIFSTERTELKNGEIREFMSGFNHLTVWSKSIELPERIREFATLVMADFKDHKFDQRCIDVEILDKESYIASSDILKVSRLYPKLPIISVSAGDKGSANNDSSCKQ